jgi:transposase
LSSYPPDYHPIEYLWKKTTQRATHHKYFKEWTMLVVSVDKAPADFAMHSEKMIGTFWFYCEEYGVELK